MTPRRRSAALAVAAITATAVVAVPTAAWAKYSGAATASLPVTSDTLGAPGSVTWTKHCTFFGLGGNTVTIDWTASADLYTTGYTVTLTPASGSASSSSVTGRTTTETTMKVPAISTAYTVSVASTYRDWTSTTTNASTTVSCSLVGTQNVK